MAYKFSSTVALALMAFMVDQAKCEQDLAVENNVAFDCDLFDVPEAVIDGALGLVNEHVQSCKAASADVVFDLECISKAVKRNYLEATEVMIAEYFSKEPQRASQAESTARITIDQIRNRQDDFLSRFEQIPKSIPTISPAFNWAQSLDHAYLEVKYSTRFDSPACLDIFDTEFSIDNEGKQLNLSAMCRNDKKLLKYELRLDLFESVSVEKSHLEDSSVGRVFVTLAKEQEPARWKRLLADNSMKPQNMGVWWELWEKYEKELEEFDPDDGEDEDEEGDDVVITGQEDDQEGATGDGSTKKTTKKTKNKSRKKKKLRKISQSSRNNSGSKKSSESQSSNSKSSSSWYNPLSWF